MHKISTATKKKRQWYFIFYLLQNISRYIIFHSILGISLVFRRFSSKYRIGFPFWSWRSKWRNSEVEILTKLRCELINRLTLWFQIWILEVDISSRLCCRSVWITSEKLLRVVLTNVFDYFAMRVRVWASRSDVTCDPRPFCSLSCYARPTLQILVTNLHQNWKSSVKTRGNNRQLIRTNVTDFMEWTMKPVYVLVFTSLPWLSWLSEFTEREHSGWNFVKWDSFFHSTRSQVRTLRDASGLFKDFFCY